MVTKVRKATAEDKLTFAFLADAFLKESGYGLTMNPDKLLANFDFSLTSSDIEIFLLDVDGTVVGMLVGAISQPLFSDDSMATELAWYISPDKRGGREAFQLIKTYEEWAKEQGCSFVTMVDIDSLNSLEKVYTKKGYKLTEKTYVKEI